MNSKFQKDGFLIIDDFYKSDELNLLSKIISSKPAKNDSFIVSKNLFAIRRLFATIPSLVDPVFTPALKKLVSEFGGSDYFLTKAIYFDKPPHSNWFVAFHQDLSISVNQKADLEGYKNWTVKRGQIGVRPPKEVLENILTVRIHLDDTNSNNGALKVIPKSHNRGILRSEKQKPLHEDLYNCEVPKGGIMLMKPLLFHASSRSQSNNQRRVIHLEFSNVELEHPLEWAERLSVSN